MDRYSRDSRLWQRRRRRRTRVLMTGLMARIAYRRDAGPGIGGIVRRRRSSFGLWTLAGPDRVSPFAVPMMLPNMASGQVSIALQARGRIWPPMSACSSAADALGLAADTIRRHEAEVMVVGGAEAPLCEMAVAWIRFGSSAVVAE